MQKMDIQIVIYAQNGILISKQHKTKQTIIQTTVWMNFRNLLYRRSQDPKNYALYDFIYMKANLIYGDKHQNIGCL